VGENTVASLVEEMSAIQLIPGRERSVLLKHPWVFSGAVQKVLGDPVMGDTVEVLDSRGQFLGRAAYNPNSSIRARIWTWSQVSVGEDFIRAKLESAVALRRVMLANEDTEMFRLVHAESDGIPGLIVDQYCDWLVVQFLTAGIERWREAIISFLKGITGVTNVYERSDVDVRELEGLPATKGVLSGEEPGRFIARENGLSFWVDIASGQKTGFYLDQRANRQFVRQLVKDRTVLNCFSYTGAFSIYALAGGAKAVTEIESSADALEIARSNISLNNLPADSLEQEQGDVFKVLRSYRDQARQYDAIILDPPKFAPTHAQAQKAARGYKDINLLAFKLLKPGGLLFTFSCSGGIAPELFQKIVADAALDAGVQARVTAHLFQGADHPVALNFPEGAYLKGLVCYVTA
jgi:23S rRNA (cytosine1962-C5)-methyltransferase